MNKVIGGLYSDSVIKMDGYRRCLFIKQGSEYILLTKDSVIKYTFKENKGIAPINKIYAIEWSDGQTSVIQIEKPLETFLITGCESSAIADDVADKRKRETWIAIVIGILVFAATFFIGYQLISKDDNNAQPTSHGTWAEWDGKSEKLPVDMLVQTTDTMALTSTTGIVSGYFINQSDKTWSHLEATYIVSNSIEAIGSCTFSAFDLSLKPGESQGFTAICDAWGDMPRIELVNVGFY